MHCAAVVSALVITGCATPGSPTEGRSANADAELVSALRARTGWSATGALGLWSERTETSPEQSITASVQWAERNDNLGVILRGPLGIGEMNLQATPAGASLKRGNSNVFGDDPDTLVQQALDLAVPVPFSQLSKWMRGLPGDANSVTYDGQGRLQSLTYADGTGVSWQALIRRYIAVDGLQVPSLITATGGPYNIRLVLKNWRFDSVNSDRKPAVNDAKGRLVIPNSSS